MWLPVSCSKVTVIRLWMPCQEPKGQDQTGWGPCGWRGACVWGARGVRGHGQGGGIRGGAGKASHLVQQEGPRARHATTVVHHCRDVTVGGGRCEARACPLSARPQQARGPEVSVGWPGPQRPKSAERGAHTCHLDPSPGPCPPAPSTAPGPQPVPGTGTGRTRRWPPARRSRSRRAGRTCSGRARGTAGSAC